MTIEPAKCYETCLATVKEKSGIEDWCPEDSDWERLTSLEARATVEPLSSHIIFAEVVLKEPRVSDAIPWPITELFRLCPHAKDLLWYDPKRSVWHEAAGGNGSALLKDDVAHRNHPPEALVILRLRQMHKIPSLAHPLRYREQVLP